MRRALLIGSQTGGLTGVHGDIELMDVTLRKLGFTTIPSTGKDAATDEILARYRGLIEDTTPDDTAVVYYSGHGARQRNPQARTEPGLPTWLQYIVPTDYDDRSGGRARCILAEELSALQADLTRRTRNVVVILDCCHAARMSRGEQAVPKAFDQLVLPAEDLAHRWRTLQAGQPLGADANPDAVRLVACGPDQSAYEDTIPGLGRRHGLLTAALVRLLTSPEALDVTWSDALEVIRAAMPAQTAQRPDLEGPADRLLFSLRTRDRGGVSPVRVIGGEALLPDAALFGITVGDTYEIITPGTESPVDRAVVAEIDNGHGVLRLTRTTTADLPPGTSARPVEYAPTRPKIAVVPAGNAHRGKIVTELERTARVHASTDPAESLATIRIDDDTMQILDAANQPLYLAPRPMNDAHLADVVSTVVTLAVAEHVRTLPSGTGAAALLDDVAVQYLRVGADGSHTALSPDEHLFTGDRLLLRMTNNAAERRYVSVFDIGLAGKVFHLTISEGSGLTLEPGETYDIGPQWQGGALPLAWPEKLPTVGPRPESFITIVADRPVDGISRLGQPGVTRRVGTNALQRLVDDLAVGRRDVPPPRVDTSIRWRTDRFDFLLHPARRTAAAEPRFEIDERPDPSFRLVTPRGIARPPGRVAVRLKNLVVHSNRSFLRSKVRVDCMVITAVAADAGSPYRASTLRFDRVQDGDQLPFDDVLIYDGPVARFLDIAVWVAKDDSADTDLAEQLATKLSDKEVAGAVTTLAALALAAPAAAAVAGSAAAIAILIRTAAQLVDRARGTSIGVYRTTLMPHQQFGAADGVGRHPAAGLLRAQDMSFAFEVIDLETRQ